MSSPSQVNTGSSGGLNSQDGVPQQQEAVPLCIPQVNHRQILSHWQSFQDLKLMFVGSLRLEHPKLSLLSQQCIVDTVEDSVLRTEMTGLESQEEDAPKRILFFKPMT